MKKLYTVFLAFFLLLFFHQSSAQILTFSFSGSNGDEATWPTSATGAGIQPTSISRGPGLTAIPNADRFNSRAWTTAGTLDLNDYLEFTITPTGGYSFTLTSITMQHQRSNTGPRTFVIRTSLDGFAADATNVVTVPDINTNQSSSFTFLSAITSTVPVTIRIYAYNAENTNGTWGPGESADGNDLQAFGSFVLLPVNFVQVAAVKKNNHVEISWTNATETDLVYYSVERSGDGQGFTELATLNPLNNNGMSAAYLILDAHPLNKVNFYRIKALETTGKKVYSRILKIEMGAKNTGLVIYPNPAPRGSQLSVQINNLPEGNYRSNVYSITGQLVRSQNFVVSGSSLTQIMSLENWNKGMYILEITGNMKLEKQFLVQ